MEPVAVAFFSYLAIPRSLDGPLMTKRRTWPEPCVRRARAARGTRPEMLSTPLVRHTLRDESVTRGLGDMEARMLVEWLTDRAERIADASANEPDAWAEVRSRCRQARVIGSFVRLWSTPESRGAAIQLAGAERLPWPLPAGELEPSELMGEILAWIDRHDQIAAASLVRRAA